MRGEDTSALFASVRSFILPTPRQLNAPRPQPPLRKGEGVRQSLFLLTFSPEQRDLVAVEIAEVGEVTKRAARAGFAFARRAE
jgi:hypothetical protein